MRSGQKDVVLKIVMTGEQYLDKKNADKEESKSFCDSEQKLMRVEINFQMFHFQCPLSTSPSHVNRDNGNQGYVVAALYLWTIKIRTIVGLRPSINVDLFIGPRVQKTCAIKCVTLDLADTRVETLGHYCETSVHRSCVCMRV